MVFACSMRSHGSIGSFEVTDPQIISDTMAHTPRLAGAMTIRPGGPAQSTGRRSMEGSVHHGNASLHRSSTQESMAVTGNGPSWLEMSHEFRAQRAKEVLLQVRCPSPSCTVLQMHVSCVTLHNISAGSVTQDLLLCTGIAFVCNQPVISVKIVVASHYIAKLTRLLQA